MCLIAVHDIVGVQLRNTATVGGSIYGRFGFSDVLSAFLALDSYVELTGAGRVPLAEFDVIEHIVVVKHDYRASYEAVRFSYPHFEFGPELERLGGVDKKAPSQISYPEPSATRGEVVSQKRVRALAARICYHS